MTLRHYRIFVKVCQCMSMTTAAEQLHLSQPAVSQAIKELSEHFGVKLFERVGNNLMATADASLLREYADVLLESYANIENRRWAQESDPEIRLGLDVPVWNMFVPSMLSRYMEQLGQCRPVLEANTTGILIQEITTRELDFAIIKGIIFATEALVIHKLAQDELVFVCLRDNPYISVKDGEKVRVDPKQFAQWPLLLPVKSSGARAVFNAAMSLFSLEYRVVGHFNNDRLLMGAVEHGIGIGVVSKYEKIDRNKFHTFSIEGLELKTDINFIYQKGRTLTPEMIEFRDFILENCTLP